MERSAEAAWRAALDRDSLGRLVVQLLAERDDLRSAVGELEASRAWRGAHATMLLVARARGGATQDRSALDVIRTLLDRPLSPTDGIVEPWPSVQPHRHHSPSAEALTALMASVTVNIVVPIHNAVDALEKCLASVARNTSVPTQLVLVDDGSTDPAVASLLEHHAGRPGITVLRHAHPLGFAAAVNLGLRESAGCDVVVLNSDTEVPPRWLQGLMLAAHSDPAVATATPVSNDAGVFSVPTPRISNPLPEGLGPDDVGRLIDRSALRRYPRTPSGGGFCLYLKRAALAEIGPFDALSYPRGYGEENDWCMSAARAGWAHVVDDATFVFHRRGASFGAEKEHLSQSAQATIARRHPAYFGLARAFAESMPLAEVSSDVRRTLHGASERNRPRRRVLIARDEHSIRPAPSCMALGEHDVLVLEGGEAGAKLVRAGRSDPWPLAEWSDCEDAVAQALAGYGVELVDGSDAPTMAPALARLAEALHLPVVSSDDSPPRA